MEKINAIRGFVALLMAFLWLLPSVGEARPIIEVNCPGDTIQDKLKEAQPGDTLLVSGTCNENVVISEEVHRITLDGQGTATINGGPAMNEGSSVITVRGTGITIKGFTITGGLRGIIVTRGGTALIDSNIIQNANSIGDSGGAGVFVNRHSSAQILNNTIQNNARNGIQVGNHSYARIGFTNIPDARISQPNTIQNNGNVGISVGGSSSVQIGYNAITKNGGTGIFVGDGSSAQIGGVSNTEPSGNTIQGNSSDGIRVSGSSTARIAGNTISNHKGSGVFVNLNSSAFIFSDIGPTPNTISGSGLATARRDGILVLRSSSASISGSTISNNTANGVSVARASHADIGGNTIEANTFDGILLQENSGLNLGSANTTTVNNGGRGLRCLIGAYARGSLGTLNGNAGQTSFDATCINATTP